VKCTNIARILPAILILTVFCTLAQAGSERPAPRFTAHTLSGEVFDNQSLSGNVVLLQFWATWCPYCRRDQPAVDKLQHAFAAKGLIILAVDVGESEAVVRKYLKANPRSCRVVLNNGLASRFGAHGFPYYVLIDRQGNIAGTQSGSGGEESLLDLLSRAGLSMHSPAREAGDESTSAPGSSGVKVIDVPQTGSRGAPLKPSPKTVFVFKNGERLEVDHYSIDAGVLHLTKDGQQRAVALSTLDIKSSLDVNHERGVELKIPQSRSEVTIAF
jgi:thiol-disulfide isomerase/thioredoxin